MAVMTLVFMASIGFALLLWFRAESSQTAQKEKHERAELYGREGVRRALFWIKEESSTYKWGNLGASSQTIILTMEDGTQVEAVISEVGEK